MISDELASITTVDGLLIQMDDADLIFPEKCPDLESLRIYENVTSDTVLSEALILIGQAYLSGSLGDDGSPSRRLRDSVSHRK